MTLNSSLIWLKLLEALPHLFWYFGFPIFYKSCAADRFLEFMNAMDMACPEKKNA